MQLTDRFLRALEFALEKHAGQKRRGTEIPYFTHVMAVASLCLEYGGSEDQAITGLLHDVIEDCGVTEAELDGEFGPHVARLVADCTDTLGAAKPTDTLGAPKPPWRERKERYIAHVGQAHPHALLVSACDKLHNARAIVRDVRYVGASAWKRFKAPPAEILWYYESLLAAFRARGGNDALLGDLAAEVARLAVLAETKNI